MKIIHVVSSIDESTGGPARSITTAVQGLLDLPEIDVQIFTGKSKKPVTELLKHADRVLNFFNLESFGKFENFSQSFVQTDNLILHGHGMWDLPIHQMSLLARKQKIPYILTPHGMLEPWALTQRKFKKKLALLAYQSNDLKLANCIQATSEMEAENIRKLGFKNPIAIVPNGIQLPENHCLSKNQEARKILFLSRIHVKKGIEILLDAWLKLPKNIKLNWTLEIAGNGDDDYVNQIRQLIIKLNLDNDVFFHGPLFDEKKSEAYSNADIFVLPTFSENFGMVIAEAMAFGLPVITTKGAPWEELETCNAGWWIDIGVEPLLVALTDAMTLSKDTLSSMGKNGKKLVEEKYSVETVSQHMFALYEWLLQKGPKPDFVV